MKFFSKNLKRMLLACTAMLALLSKADAFASTEYVDVVIVGGGPGGMHTAYRLTNPEGAPTGVDPTKVVLLEKNKDLGGRVIDVQFGPSPEDVVGTAAYRMYDNQASFFLMNELGVEVAPQADFEVLYGLKKPPYGIFNKYYGYSDADFQSLYGSAQTPDDIWDKLLCGPQVPKDPQGNPVYEYVSDMEKKTSLDYLKTTVNYKQDDVDYFLDVNRFRADFDEKVDAAGYMNFIAADFAGGSTYYAVPGFSAAIKAMEYKILQEGGRIFTNEPVVYIHEHDDGTFTVKSKNMKFKTTHVIIATNHGAIKHMKGNVPKAIASQNEYKNITSATALTVTHKWDRKWWKEDLRYLENSAKLVSPQLPPNSDILRDVTTFYPNGYSVNSSEFPVIDYWDDLQVTRSVYTDRRDDVKDWRKLYEKKGIEGVNEEVLHSFRHLFPGVFDGSSSEPKIIQTHVTSVDEAWYYLKENALKNGVTVGSLFDWSLRPLPNKNVYLVGDTWHMRGSAWTAAAYVSSQRVLNTYFGMNRDLYDFDSIKCL